MMTLQLRQEPLDRHAHQLASAKRHHVRKHVRRVQSLMRNVQLQRLDQRRGDTVKHLGGDVVLDEQGHVSLNGRMRHPGRGRNDVQCVMPTGIHHVTPDRLFDGEVEKLLEEDRPGHRVEFLGRTTEGGMEVLGDFADWHEMQDLRAEQPRPVLPHVFDRHGRKHRFGRVEQGLLSWINSISHIIVNLHVNQ